MFVSIYGLHIDWWNVLIALFYVVSVYLSENQKYKHRIRRGMEEKYSARRFTTGYITAFLIDGVLFSVFAYYAYGGDHPYMHVWYIIISSLFYVLSFWTHFNYREEEEKK